MKQIDMDYFECIAEDENSIHLYGIASAMGMKNKMSDKEKMKVELATEEIKASLKKYAIEIAPSILEKWAI